MTSSTQTLAEFIAGHGLSIETAPSVSNPAMADDEWSRSASHYFVTIRKGDEFMSLHYSMGSALTEAPTLEMVLDSLASDIASVTASPDWLDWAEEMGYEGTDALRSARKAHRTIERQTAELQDLIGPDALDVLLYSVERL